jgi:hypothetical protein
MKGNQALQIILILASTLLSLYYFRIAPSETSDPSKVFKVFMDEGTQCSEPSEVYKFEREVYISSSEQSSSSINIDS